VSGEAVVPNHRFEHEHHPRREHERLVEVVAEVRTDERHLRAVGADAVREIEVGQPGAAALSGSARVGIG
jgi:hypothetical protein